VFASLALASVAAAGERPPGAPRLGIGISLEPSLLSLLQLGNAVYAPPIQLYVPIVLTPALRLEPAIGVISVTDKGNVIDLTSEAFSIGIGALYLRPVAAQVQLLAGGRVTVIWARDQASAGTPQPAVVESKQRNLLVALVLGGEYQPSPWFSIGLEGQLAFARLGDIEAKNTATSATATEKGGSSASTNALVFLRAYLL
jgi:hypothetical protein